MPARFIVFIKCFPIEIVNARLPLVVVNLRRIPFVFRLEFSVRVTYGDYAERVDVFRKFQCIFHDCGTLIVRRCCPDCTESHSFSGQQQILCCSRAVIYPEFLVIRKISADNNRQWCSIQSCIWERFGHRSQLLLVVHHYKSPRLLIHCARSCHCRFQQCLHLLVRNRL